MDFTFRAPLLVFAAVLIGAVLSGPLVGGVDFTTEETTTRSGPIGTGNVTVENVSLPSEATLRRGDFGSGSYYLDFPDGSLEVATRTGNPVIAYEVELDIGNISYNQESIYLVDSDSKDELRLSLKRVTFSPNEIDKQEYTGQLTVLRRIEHNSTVLARQNITVEVEE